MTKKQIKISIWAGLILILISSIYLGSSLYYFVKTPLAKPGESFTYILKPGADIKILARDLHNQGHLQHPFYFEVFAMMSDNTRQIKSGEYLIKAGTTPEQLLRKMVAGNVVQHSITFPEGWTFAKMLQALDHNPDITPSLQGLNNTEIRSRLGYTEQNPEGLFFPATYSFIKGATDVSILQEAYKTMQRILAKEWDNRAASVPYQTPYQALIAASLIEKETALLEERAVISGVILQRQKKNMPLQIDPTVIYGLGSQYNGQITDANLKQDTPYNTYLHKGLPPTPICSPSLASLHAALHPVLGTYLYFVATGLGGHFFSSTLQEHQAAVKTYRAYIAQKAAQHAKS